MIFPMMKSYKFKFKHLKYSTASGPASFKTAKPPINDLNGHLFTMCCIVCYSAPQSQSEMSVKPHLCIKEPHRPWLVWKRFKRTHSCRRSSKPGVCYSDPGSVLRWLASTSTNVLTRSQTLGTVTAQISVNGGDGTWQTENILLLFSRFMTCKKHDLSKKKNQIFWSETNFQFIPYMMKVKIVVFGSWSITCRS
jgi:hypothetical protein